MPYVAAAAAVVSAVVSVVQAQQASSAAGQQAALEQQRVQVQENQQKLQAAQQEAQLQRQARAQRASIINGAAAGNSQYSSSAKGAISAVGMNQARELGYLKQGLNLSLSADQITSQQININKSIEQENAIFSGIKGIASGVSGVEKSGVFLPPAQKPGFDESVDDNQ